MKNDRIQWIDFAKGIGIVLVIIGHIGFCPKELKTVLCSFHMPLFFFLSGVTFKPEKYRNIKSLLCNKVYSIVIPYFVFSTLNVIWKSIFLAGKSIVGIGRFSIANRLKSVLGIIVNIRGTDYAPGIWFLTCIFCCYILLYLICKLNPKNSIRAIIASMFFIVGLIYVKIIGVKLPWAIDASWVAVFFMFLGYVLNSSIARLEKIRKSILASVGGYF